MSCNKVQYKPDLQDQRQPFLAFFHLTTNTRQKLQCISGIWHPRFPIYISSSAMPRCYPDSVVDFLAS